MNKKRDLRVNTLVKASMLVALSIVLMYLVRFPIFPSASYLEYNMADVPILIGTFMFGPTMGLLLTLLVCILQWLLVSVESGWVGALMHFIATGGQVLVAGLIYRSRHTRKGAVIALTFGAFIMVALMIPLNLVMTPIFNGVPYEYVKAMILPIIVPFNAIKAAINCVITFVLYKSLSSIFKQDMTEPHKVKSKGVSLPKLAYGCMFLALALLLPFLTKLPNVDDAFLLMHIPVMVCGFVCGAPTALCVGAVAAILRPAMLGTTIIYSGAIIMAFELAAYGFFSGLLFKLLPKKLPFYYFSVIGSMILGRVIFIAVSLVVNLIEGVPVDNSVWSGLASNAVTGVIPGIILQISFIPILVAYLHEKGKLPDR